MLCLMAFSGRIPSMKRVTLFFLSLLPFAGLAQVPKGAVPVARPQQLAKPASVADAPPL